MGSTTLEPSLTSRGEYSAILGTLWIAASLAISAGCGRAPAAATDFERVWSSASAEGFNVLVITLDTTRADRLGSHGYQDAMTPVLDGLAAEGVRFADAVSCVPMTLPAHSSIFTGFDPPGHGVRSNGLYRLDERHVTLAESLREQGYQTAAFVSAFVLDARYGLSQGFEHYDDEVRGVRGSNVVQRPAGPVTDAALAWLRKRDEKRPYLMWVHYFDPHRGYDPPEPYAQEFAASPYDGEIAYMDAQVGRLLEAVSRAGRENTLVLVVGDHGQSLGEHHEDTHSRTIYEATQHVPLILWAPGLGTEAFVVDDAVVTITDVYPTVLDLLGIGAGTNGDGVSLLACRAQGNRAVYMETMRTYLDHNWAPLFGLRRHRDKYILAPTPEYYDLESDPRELSNIFDSLSGSDSPATQLAEMLAGRIDGGPLAEAIAAAASGVAPDRDALRDLQALGYASGSASDDDGELRDPKNMMPVLALTLEAKALRQAGRLEEALAKASEALERSPLDRSVLRELGGIYTRMNRAVEAEQAFAQYLEIQPDADVYWTLAQIQMQTGRAQEAGETLRLALELEPDHGGVLVASGDLAAARKEFDEAMRLYERARAVDPYRTESMASSRIARLRQQLGR